MSIYRHPMGFARNTRLTRLFTVVPILWLVVGSFCACLNHAQAAEVITQQSTGHCPEQQQQPEKSPGTNGDHCDYGTDACLTAQPTHVASEAAFTVASELPSTIKGSSVGASPSVAARDLCPAYDFILFSRPEQEHRVLLI